MLCVGRISKMAIEDIIEMLKSPSVWKVANIEDQPSVEIYDWTLKKTDKGVFFVGTERGFTGRVSTAVVEFDTEKLVGKTESGRVYKLLGEPGYSSNGEYVWETYKRINNLTEIS
jgi:hypothetical protein